MENDNNAEILKRLDTIAYLLLELKDADGKMSLKEKIRILSNSGLGYNQIARLLGKSAGSVAVQLTSIKKEAKTTEAIENDTTGDKETN